MKSKCKVCIQRERMGGKGSAHRVRMDFSADPNGGADIPPRWAGAPNASDNQTMNSLHWPRKLAAAAVLGAVALAQAPRPGESSLELEPSLFVQLPGGKSIAGAVQLVWILEPLEKYCFGK